MTSPSRPTVRAVVVASLVSLLALLLGGPPAAASAGSAGAAEGGRGSYLALGDSVPFGYSPLLAPGDASRYVGYPELAAARLGLRPVNLSCPGETTGSYASTTAPDNGCRAFRSVAPLHVGYEGTQARAATAILRADRGVRLVTLTLGANDVFLCRDTTADGCTDPAEIGAVLATVAANLDRALADLRSVYRGRLVVVGYYATDYTDPTVVGPVQALNTVLADVAARHGAELADSYRVFAAAASASGGRACQAGLLIRLPAGGCDIHPSQPGARLLATAVVLAAIGQRQAA